MDKKVVEVLLALAFYIGAAFKPPFSRNTGIRFGTEIYATSKNPLNPNKKSLNSTKAKCPVGLSKETQFSKQSRKQKGKMFVNLKNSILEKGLSNKEPIITEEIDAIIKGVLLGDGNLHARNESGKEISYRLKIAHSPNQEPYVNWLYEKLKPICQTTQGPRLRMSGKNKIIEFYPTSGKYMKSYHDLFYQPRVKNGIICTNKNGAIMYDKIITPATIASLGKNNLTVATLFMDDGSVRGDCYSGRIATQGFTLDGCNLLKDYFHEKWGIKMNVVFHSKLKKQYTLAIPSKEFSKFVDIIKPTVDEVPGMKYKLNEKNRDKSFFTEKE